MYVESHILLDRLLVSNLGVFLPVEHTLVESFLPIADWTERGVDAINYIKENH